MLMHCTNNTFAALIGQDETLRGMESYTELFPAWQYVTLLAASLFIIVIFIDIVRKNIPLASERGNCDSIDPEGMVKPEQQM